MRPPRRALLAFVLAVPLVLAGCSTMAYPSSDGGAHEDMDKLPLPPGGDTDMLPATNRAFAAPCTTNDQCASMLCTQTSYDRSPTPICTYKCDVNNMNPNCPNGCNMKGYCRLQ